MKEKKIQVIFIHGGPTFRTYKEYLQYLRARTISLEDKSKVRRYGDYMDKKLGEKFEIIRPQMPHPENGKYIERKVHFERHFPFMKDNIILIGGSLGGTFLAKYLSENKFPKKILSVYFICTPYSNAVAKASKSEGELLGGFTLKGDLAKLQMLSNKLTFIYSPNDDKVSLLHADMFKKKLPNARFLLYPHIQGHFRMEEFPEIVKMIKKDVKKL